MTDKAFQDTARTALTRKPSEVEGFFDTYFYTPFGGALARVLSRTKLTPNNVSWLSVLPAAAAAAAYLVPSLTFAIIASALFVLSGVLDSADGQLARATGRTSDLGETLDGFCDTLSFGFIYLAAGISLFEHTHASAVLVAIVAVLAGISHSIQSSLVDFERQLFIHFVTGRGRVIREHPMILGDELRAARNVGECWWPLLLRRMRLSYCKRQRLWLSSSVHLLELHQRLVEPNAQSHTWFADRYRSATSGSLRLWTVFAPNCHTLAVLICGILPFLSPSWSAARWGLGLIFIIDLSLNLAAIPLLLFQRRVDRLLAAQIATVCGGETSPSSAEK